MMIPSRFSYALASTLSSRVLVEPAHNLMQASAVFGSSARLDRYMNRLLGFAREVNTPYTYAMITKHANSGLVWIDLESPSQEEIRAISKK